MITPDGQARRAAWRKDLAWHSIAACRATYVSVTWLRIETHNKYHIDFRGAQVSIRERVHANIIYVASGQTFVWQEATYTNECRVASLQHFQYDGPPAAQMQHIPGGLCARYSDYHYYQRSLIAAWRQARGAIQRAQRTLRSLSSHFRQAGRQVRASSSIPVAACTSSCVASMRRYFVLAVVDVRIASVAG